jgi:hypothetical protein
MAPDQRKHRRRAKTFVVDLTHWLTEDGAIASMPRPAQRLAEYMGMIVADATGFLSEHYEEEGVRCRCRPGRKPCPGIIETDFEPETDRIVWWCPECGENGYISHWKGTLWDRTTDRNAH